MIGAKMGMRVLHLYAVDVPSSVEANRTKTHFKWRSFAQAVRAAYHRISVAR